MELDLNELEKQEGQSPFVSKFQSFFETQYSKPIERLAMDWPQKRSLFVNFSDLEHYDFELADQLLESPDVLNEAAEMAVQNIHVTVLETKEFKPHVRFFNLPKDRMPLLRNISSDHLGKLVAVEGVVRQLTDVLPKLKVAAWQCRRCGNVYKREQENDRISMPPMCECKHRDFDLLQEESTFIDNQKIQIQEPLEMLKGSEQATILDVIVADDLVNRVMPGDRTRIVGIVRLRTPKEKNLVYGRFLEAVHLEETAKEFEEVEIAPEEKKEIEALSKNPKIYELLGKSIAPNIYGHEIVKEAIALQLFGGVKKILPNDTNIRGNIHVLLVGDPGCLVADERVVLGNGAIENIGNLGSEHLQEISAQVLTGEGAKKRDLATVFHYYQNQAVMEIVTESGKSIKGTPNHPLLCISKENDRLKRGWKRLDEFKIGDTVAVVTSVPCTIKAFVSTGFKPLQKKYGPHFRGKLPEKVTPELAGLLGYLVGDGWITKYKTGFVVNEEEKDLLPKLLGASHRLFGIRPVPRPRKLSEGRKVQLYYCEINSEDVARNLSFLREKRVPALVLRSGNKVASEFLKWLFEADGCCFCKGRGRRAIALKAKNVELLRDVQMLLLRFAIHSRITANALQIRRGKGILKYAKHIGFVSNKKKEKLTQLCKEAETVGRFNSQRSEKIVKIIHHPAEDVFDIEVPKGHRFIANGIISHNTAKSQMLQSVNKIAPKSIYTAGKTSTGVGLCVAPDSLVNLNGEMVRIGDLVEKNFDAVLAKEEAPGVWSCPFAGNTVVLADDSRVEKGEIEKIWKIKAPEYMVRIRTCFGKELCLTPATQLVCWKGTTIGWVPSDHLEAGNVIAISAGSVESTPLVAGEKSQQILVAQGAVLKWDAIECKEYFVPSYDLVYDFTIKTYRNFIANGFFVHNTASAVKDDFGEGGWTLKAGALVLANGGLAMVDEFDKMLPEDRSAMHEAMEQGMISVAKAGIVTRFKTDTTILAAANPKFARFDQYKNFLEQIDLPPTLISRFDLFFMIFDVLDRKKDEDIAQHILKTHQAGEMTLQRRARGLGKQKETSEFEESMSPAIAGNLFKKYLAFARQNIFPVLTKEAIQAISDYYVDLRELGKKQGTYTATHRQLEGLVRLSEASARIRLSNTVEKEDTERAIRLLRTSLQELVTDKETGRLDIDMLTSGQSTSQTNQLKGVLGIVQRLNQEHDKVLLEQVFDEAQKLGIDREKTREIISKLKRQGDLYEPSLGIIKPVPKEF